MMDHNPSTAEGQQLLRQGRGSLRRTANLIEAVTQRIGQGARRLDQVAVSRR